MRDLVRLNGAVSYNRSAQRTGFVMPVMQQGKVAPDSDINLQSQLHINNLRNSALGIAGNGVPVLLSPQFGGSAGANQFYLHSSSFPVLVDGDTVWVTGENGSPHSSASSLPVLFTLAAPPAGGQPDRYDMVWLEVWYAEVAPVADVAATPTTVPDTGYIGTGSNNFTNQLQNPAVGAETCRAIQRRFRLRSTASSAFTQTGDGFLESPTIPPRCDAAADVTTYPYGSASAYAPYPLHMAGASNPLDSANALYCADGYAYAIPLYKVLRQASRTSVLPGDVHFIPSAYTRINAHTVDGFQISASPLANEMLPLNSQAQFPASVIPPQSIDKTKAGANVLFLEKRHGGDPNVWTTAGTADYAVNSMVEVQVGMAQVILSLTNVGSVNVVIPDQYDQTPLVFLQPVGSAIAAVAAAVTNKSITISVQTFDASLVSGTFNIAWLAIGPVSTA